MGSTKKEFYTEHQLEMAKLCKALGHPARIAIVEKLMEHDGLNCSDLRFFIPLAQSTISRHLKELHDAGILSCAVIGNNSYYQIQERVLKEVSEHIDMIRLGVQRENYLYKNAYSKPRIHYQSTLFMRV